MDYLKPAWVGLDIAEFASLVLLAYALHKRTTWTVLVATTTAALLSTDALINIVPVVGRGPPHRVGDGSGGAALGHRGPVSGRRPPTAWPPPRRDEDRNANSQAVGSTVRRRMQWPLPRLNRDEPVHFAQAVACRRPGGLGPGVVEPLDADPLVRRKVDTVRTRRRPAARTVRRSGANAPFLWVAAAVLVTAMAALAGCTGTANVAAMDEIGAAPPTITRTDAATPDLQKMVDDFRAKEQAPGLAMAVVTPSPGSQPGSAPLIQYFSSGSPALNSPQAVTNRTQFELGSESKTFTAALLSVLVAQGKVGLDDPVQKYAPAGITVPGYPTDAPTTPITLRDLVTHQSALPDDPANIDAGCPNQQACPTAKQSYTRDMLWAGLAQTKLPWRPGTNWLYSNFGFALLGTILADLVDPGQQTPPYQSALQAAYLQSLPMPDTQLESPTPQLAVPYAGAAVAPYWNNTNAFAGGGGLISSPKDMATWTALMLGYPVGQTAGSNLGPVQQTIQPLADISQTCTEPDVTTCATPSHPLKMGMGWENYASGIVYPCPYVTKNGGTSGMNTVTFLVPAKGIGVTLLDNDANAPVEYFGQSVLLALASSGC